MSWITVFASFMAKLKKKVDKYYLPASSFSIENKFIGGRS